MEMTGSNIACNIRDWPIASPSGMASAEDKAKPVSTRPALIRMSLANWPLATRRLAGVEGQSVHQGR
jgi:hypothetical protein